MDFRSNVGDEMTREEAEKGELLVDFKRGGIGLRTYSLDGKTRHRVKTVQCKVCLKPCHRVESNWVLEDGADHLVRKVTCVHEVWAVPQEHVDEKGTETDTAIVMASCEYTEQGTIDETTAAQLRKGKQ